jgi:hypothetical protein
MWGHGPGTFPARELAERKGSVGSIRPGQDPEIDHPEAVRLNLRPMVDVRGIQHGELLHGGRYLMSPTMGHRAPELNPRK